jgi:formiminotetrahydrofolate cyclodeaminase
MPKETEEQKEMRKKALQDGYKSAALVPLETAKTCAETLDAALIVAKKGNKNSITDSGVSALMARAGVEAAILNIKINLGSIEDEVFVEKISSEIEKIRRDAEDKTKEVMKIVEASI